MASGMHTIHMPMPSIITEVRHPTDSRSAATRITPGPPKAPPMYARLVALPRCLVNQRATITDQDTP